MITVAGRSPGDLLAGLQQQLEDDHVRMLRVLELTQQQVCGAAPDWPRVAALLEFLSEYSDRVHYPQENRVLDRLLQNCVTPAQRQMVYLDLAEHERMLSRTNALREIVHGFAAGAPRDESLCAEVCSYLDVQRAHIALEERRILPLLEERLSAGDWLELEAEIREEARSSREALAAAAAVDWRRRLLQRYAQLTGICD
ncbi:MAG: hemerythrin domain-containing protein [Pseudomonadales bacterium]